MNHYSETLNQCKAQFAPTTEYSTLINYRMRETRLTMDDKLRVAKTIEHTYAPLLYHLKTDVPSLSDSDMLFCILSTLNGIDCGGKGTSCPDQLCRALEQLKAQ